MTREERINNLTTDAQFLYKLGVKLEIVESFMKHLRTHRESLHKVGTFNNMKFWGTLKSDKEILKALKSKETIDFEEFKTLVENPLNESTVFEGVSAETKQWVKDEIEKVLAKGNIFTKTIKKDKILDEINHITKYLDNYSKLLKDLQNGKVEEKFVTKRIEKDVNYALSRINKKAVIDKTVTNTMEYLLANNLIGLKKSKKLAKEFMFDGAYEGDDFEILYTVNEEHKVEYLTMKTNQTEWILTDNLIYSPSQDFILFYRNETMYDTMYETVIKHKKYLNINENDVDLLLDLICAIFEVE